MKTMKLTTITFATLFLISGLYAQTTTTFDFNGFYSVNCNAAALCSGVSSDTDAVGNRAMIQATSLMLDVKVISPTGNVVSDVQCAPIITTGNLANPYAGETTTYVVDCGSFALTLNLRAYRIGGGRGNPSHVYWYGNGESILTL
jgi:hypothetical protein